MTGNQINYWKLQEEKRTHAVNEQIASDTLKENQRHNLAAESETQTHNRETERQSLIGLGIDQQNADTNKRNAATNERNADVNQQNADTNKRNAATNEFNAQVNLRNAITNERNAATNERNAATNAYAAQTGRLAYEESARHNAVSEAQNQISVTSTANLQRAQASLVSNQAVTETMRWANTQADTDLKRTSADLNTSRVALNESQIALNDTQAGLNKAKKAESTSSTIKNYAQAASTVFEMVAGKGNSIAGLAQMAGALAG